MQQQKLPFTNLIQNAAQKNPQKNSRVLEKKKSPKKNPKKFQNIPSRDDRRAQIFALRNGRFWSPNSSQKERKKESERERKREEAAGLYGVDK